MCLQYDYSSRVYSLTTLVVFTIWLHKSCLQYGYISLVHSMTTLVVFWQDQKSSNWTENNVLSGNKVNDGNTLMDFAIWSNAQKSVLPRHDHAALYTGWVSEREREKI